MGNHPHFRPLTARKPLSKKIQPDDYIGHLIPYAKFVFVCSAEACPLIGKLSSLVYIFSSFYLFTGVLHTTGSNTSDVCRTKGVIYVVPKLCFKRRSFYTDFPEETNRQTTAET